MFRGYIKEFEYTKFEKASVFWGVFTKTIVLHLGCDIRFSILISIFLLLKSVIFEMLNHSHEVQHSMSKLFLVWLISLHTRSANLNSPRLIRNKMLDQILNTNHACENYVSFYSSDRIWTFTFSPKPDVAEKCWFRKWWEFSLKKCMIRKKKKLKTSHFNCTCTLLQNVILFLLKQLIFFC